MSRVLITGLGGFLGSHLAEYLLAEGHDVAGTVRRGSPPDLAGDAVNAIPCDILDAAQVEAAVASARPEVIFHFAAQSLPVVSWRDPGATFRVNVLGTLHLLEAVRRANLDPIIVVAGSSAEYGPQPLQRPIPEDEASRPSSPYGASKEAAGRLAAFYANVFRMRAVRVRPFQVIGPRKAGDVSSDLARGIAAVERGHQSTLQVGNVEAVRDFLDVRDAVRACWLVARRGTPGRVYNICSGVGHSVRQVLDTLLACSGSAIVVERDPTLLRPNDRVAVVGDNSRLRGLGWQPTVPLPESLSDILDYWRKREIGAEAAGSAAREVPA